MSIKQCLNNQHLLVLTFWGTDLAFYMEKEYVPWKEVAKDRNILLGLLQQHLSSRLWLIYGQIRGKSKSKKFK